MHSPSTRATSGMAMLLREECRDDVAVVVDGDDDDDHDGNDGWDVVDCMLGRSASESFLLQIALIPFHLTQFFTCSHLSRCQASATHTPICSQISTQTASWQSK